MTGHTIRISLPLLIVLAGCASSGDANKSDRQAATRTTEPVAMATEAPDPGALGGFAIPSGRCGLVLWARAGKSAVPIFQGYDNGEAVMKIDGESAALTRQSDQGVARAGMPQRQTFLATLSSGGVVTVDADVVWGQSFPGGSYVDRGTIALTGDDGWSRVLPVAGIAGCKA